MNVEVSASWQTKRKQILRAAALARRDALSGEQRAAAAAGHRAARTAV